MNNLITISGNDILIAEEFTNKLIEFEQLKKEIEYQSELLKSELLDIMPKMGKDRVILDGISITYRKASKRNTVDSKKLKELYPDIAQECSKESDVSPSIIIKVED